MLTVLLTLLKGLVIVLTIIAILTFLFLKLAPTFGSKPDKETQARINNSPNFNGETFVNLTATHASTINIQSITADTETKDDESTQSNHFLQQFLFPPKGKNPETPINTVPLSLIASHQAPTLQARNSSKSTAATLKNGEFVWLGHSTVLFRTASLTLITDPVFYRASPVPVGGKPFPMKHTPSVADLPFIDVVLISHDHYDHLDHKAIKRLKDKVGHFYVPLGVKAHLIRWGVEATNISEYDWYESTEINASNNNETIKVTFTPARHFSGRRITGHRTTLWGGWAVESADLSVFFSGDGGYSAEFAKIGERFGGFDVAFIEDGAYNVRWQDVHMLPEDSAQAGIDVGAKVLLPIHWGKFDLSTHHWREPVRRIKSSIAEHNKSVPDTRKIALVTPRIGQVFDLDNLPTQAWWEDEP